MFQTASAFRLSPRSLTVSLALHAAGILLLCLVSFPGSPLRPRMPMAVPLLAPAAEISAPRVHVSRVRLPSAHHRVMPRFMPPPEIEPKPAILLPDLPPPTLSPSDLARPPAPDSVRISIPGPPPAPAAPLRIGTFENAAPASVPQPSSPKPVLRSAGFAAAQSPAFRPPQKTLAPTGAFDTAVTALPRRTEALEVTRAAATPATPVEILDKPKPAYTAEARRLNIQGEVLLEVVFEASGQARVLRVVRGLGHGLDETAQAAARQIHFRPAQREGTPVDSSAVVHIIFQLAY